MEHFGCSLLFSYCNIYLQDLKNEIEEHFMTHFFSSFYDLLEILRYLFSFFMIHIFNW